MSVATAGTFTIDGQSWAVTDVERVGPTYQSINTNVPDENWTAVDANGHEHRYWRRLSGPGKDPELPTLERHIRHVECDGTGLHAEEFCTGWDEPYWLCVQCGDEVRPGVRRGTVQDKVSDSYYRVTASCDLADLADEDGTITLGRAGARNEPARLWWPSGPGQVLDLPGRAWTEQPMSVEHRGPLGTLATQVWALRPDTEETLS